MPLKADGYVLLEVNTLGRAKCSNIHYFDMDMEQCEIDSEEMAESLLNQLPEGVNDMLIMALFKVEFPATYDYWSGATEYDMEIELISHNIVADGYKEHYREQVTKDIFAHEYVPHSEEVVNYLTELITEWEEFYEEDFVPANIGKHNEMSLRIGRTFIGVDFGTPDGDKGVMVRGFQKSDGSLELFDVKELEELWHSKQNNI